jgi:hypothetical protein
MTRYRDHYGQAILPLVMAALLVPLAGCGSTRADAGSTGNTTQSTASTTGTATPSRMTAQQGSEPPLAPCLRPDNGGTVTNIDLATSGSRLCLAPGSRVTVNITPSNIETWTSHPQLTGTAVRLTSTLAGNAQRLELTAVRSGEAAVTVAGAAVHGPASVWTLTVTVH